VRDSTTALLEECANRKNRIEKHFSLLTKYVEPDVLDADDEYEVSHIVDEKLFDGEVKYRVRWKGYDSSHDSWLNTERLVNAPKVLQAWKRQSKRSKRNKRNKRETFNVTKIIDHKKENNKVLYLTSRGDVGPDDYRWLTKEQIRNKPILQEYNRLGGML